MPHTNQHRGQCIPISTLNAAYASIVAITAIIVMATKQQHTHGHAHASCVPTEVQYRPAVLDGTNACIDTQTYPSQ